MRAVLGIDAAWTVQGCSGVAFVTESDKGWQCRAVAPSYASFNRLSQKSDVNWDETHRGEAPNLELLLDTCLGIEPNADVRVIAVDMPLASHPILRRRVADRLTSRAFGRYQAAVHSPNAVRPGEVATQIYDEANACGYRLATRPTPDYSLIEVYPHAAIIRLLQLNKRLPYKSGNTTKYWKGLPEADRKRNLLLQWHQLATALCARIEFTISRMESLDHLSFSRLKAIEDCLDAIVCAWTAIMFLEGNAEPFGDEWSAIWVPQVEHT